MGKQIDLTGQRFGRLVAISAEKDPSGRRYIWTCLCDCGNYVKAETVSLTHNLKTSCGCLRREVVGNRNRTHGYSGERLHKVWKGMRSRCNNPNHKSYARYGGRGIRVCDEWDDYMVFRSWAYANGYREDAPYMACTLDRIDVDKGYSPDNCRWVDETTQANNTRTNRMLTHNGETKTVSEWSKELGVDKAVLYARINNLGWDAEKALTTPTRKCKPRHSG